MTAPQQHTVEPVAPRRPRRNWVPPQHGAWAMLALPFVAGLLVGRVSWVHAPLALAWFSGYCAVYFVMLGVKTGRWTRIRPQVIAYVVPALVGGMLVAVARPGVLWWLLAVLPILGVSALASRKHAERGLLNDFVLVALAALMVPISVSVALPDAARLFTTPVLVTTGLVFVYLGGTVLYVKTMIRERGSRGFRVASVLWHLAGLASSAVVAPVTAPVFAWFAVRAWWFPRLGLRPMKVGLAEIGGSLALLVSLWVWL